MFVKDYFGRLAAKLAPQGYDYTHYFDACFAKVNSTQLSDRFAPDDNGMYAIVIDSTCEYIRLSMGEFSEETIITVNEEIT